MGPVVFHQVNEDSESGANLQKAPILLRPVAALLGLVEPQELSKKEHSISWGWLPAAAESACSEAQVKVSCLLLKECPEVSRQAVAAHLQKCLWQCASWVVLGPRELPG